MAQKKKNWTKEFPPPKEVPIPMEYANKRNLVVPSSEKRINAIVFDLIHQLRRVIQDPEATSSENTILDRDNTYQPYKPNRFIEKIQDTRVFQETVCKYKDDPDVFVISLLAYTEKTHVTGDGRFCAEPVVMVPSFLKLSKMRKAKRQMILGLISDMDQKSSSVRATLSTASPCRNYHAQLSVIVENLREIQKQGGVWMKLRMHGIEVVKRVILPLLVFKGDAKSQDNIVGRYASNLPSVGRLTWSCTMTSRNALYPWRTCNFFDRKLIHKLSMNALGLDEHGEEMGESSEQSSQAETQKRREEAQQQLHSIGQYQLKNAFADIYMGEGLNARCGIFSAACCDVMHTLKSGIMKYVMTDFFLLMTKKERAMFDFVYNQIFKSNRQSVFSFSSSDGYPKTKFSKGVSTISYVTANEWVGIMFTAAALCVTVRGQLIFAETMKQKWEKNIKEWKEWKANRSSLATDNGNRNDASPQNDDQRGGDPDDDDYEEDEEDLKEARESFFADDPVAYQSIWDNGEREPYLDFLELFECLLTFNSWVRMDCFWESDFESTTGQAKKAFIQWMENPQVS